MRRLINWFHQRSKLDKALIIGGAISLVAVVSFFFWWLGTNEFVVSNIAVGEDIVSGASPLSGLPCNNIEKRPIAIMIAADHVARPLSGLAQADAVFEMPVTPNKIPRYMAVFQCQNVVSEIGSIRSAREDFLPLAASLGAIYVHWGGEREVLERLNNGVIDNIDALKYDGTVFYRKKEIPMPHNGFTTIDKLTDKAEDLNYSLDLSFEGYPHKKDEGSKNLANLADRITIDYASPYEVRWEYDSNSKVYKRFRGGEPEIDKTNNQQVTAGTIIVMDTSSKIINLDYITINVSGGGDLRVYKYGTSTSGHWQKGPNLSDKLYFYDSDNKEISLAPGTLWVHINANPQ